MLIHLTYLQTTVTLVELLSWVRDRLLSPPRDRAKQAVDATQSPEHIYGGFNVMLIICL